MIDPIAAVATIAVLLAAAVLMARTATRAWVRLGALVLVTTILSPLVLPLL